MIRHVSAAVTALFAVVAFPLAPQAAADGDQTVLIDGGRVKCSVSANDIPRGGGPIVACQRTDGLPFAQSMWSAEKYSERLTLAVKRSTGEFYWDGGNVRNVSDVTGEPIAVGVGQTYNANGWTIQVDEQHTRISNDSTGYGMYVAAEDINHF
jgi:hypothetical protein